MFSDQPVAPHGNGFKARYLLPSHWPILCAWFAAPPDAIPPLKDSFPVPPILRGLLWFPVFFAGLLTVMTVCSVALEPLMTFWLNLVNGWPYRPDILDYPPVPGWPFALGASLSIVAMLPASIVATIYNRRPCGIFHACSVLERVIGYALEAPFRIVKAQLGGERRIVEQFDVSSSPPGPRPSKYTNVADAWLCAPNPETRWHAKSRPAIAIKLRYLFTTRYFLRTTLGVMILFSVLPLYLGALYVAFWIVFGPIVFLNERLAPVLVWILGATWVVVSGGGMIYAAIRIFGHDGAYAVRAKKRAAKGLPVELAVLEAAEVYLRRRYTDWWERL